MEWHEESRVIPWWAEDVKHEKPWLVNGPQFEWLDITPLRTTAHWVVWSLRDVYKQIIYTHRIICKRNQFLWLTWKFVIKETSKQLKVNYIVFIPWMAVAWVWLDGKKGVRKNIFWNLDVFRSPFFAAIFGSFGYVMETIILGICPIYSLSFGCKPTVTSLITSSIWS